MIFTAEDCAKKGDFLTAINLCYEVLDRCPDSKEAKVFLQKITSLISRLNAKADDLQVFETIPGQLRDQLWLLYQQEQFSDLLGLIESLQDRCPEDYEFYFLAGSCARKLGNFETSNKYLQKALQLEPDNFGANLEVAKLFLDNSMLELAKKTLDFCSTLKSEVSEIHWMYGDIARQQNVHSEALSHYCEAQRLNHPNKSLKSHIGMCYFEMGEYETALQILREDLSEKENDGEIDEFYLHQLHSNILVAAFEIGKLENIQNSIDYVKDYIEKNPEYSKNDGTTRFALAHAYLSSGQCKEGWKHYWHRFDYPNFTSEKRVFSVPRLTDISMLNNKRVLIWREQGVGDEILFMGLLGELISKTNAQLIVECDKRLIIPLSRSFPNVTFRPPSFNRWSLKCQEVDFDGHLPMGDIPILLEFCCNGPQKVNAWWKTSEKNDKFWRDELHFNEPLIGFAWGGSVQNVRFNKYYLDLDFFRSLIEQTMGFKWIWLDYVADKSDYDLLPLTVREKVIVPDINIKDDFDSVATLLNLCNLSITPYSATRNLSGAVGTKNISFVHTPHAYDLGGAIDDFGYTHSPLIPRSKMLVTGDVRDKVQYRQKLVNFFKHELSLIHGMPNLK